MSSGLRYPAGADTAARSNAGRSAPALEASSSASHIAALAGPSPRLRVEGLSAGYGSTEVVHDLDLQLAAGQSLCLIGPNGAGKSTVLNALYGYADIRKGRIVCDGRDITHLPAEAKLGEAGIAYVLQDGSVFPDMSVEDNLRLGGWLMRRSSDVRRAVDRIFERYPGLAGRRDAPARVLSGGERRLLEIARALMMSPRVLLIDEPTIGLEPRYVDLVFEALGELRHHQGLSILLVEQNALKGLAFADVGYVLVSGRVAMAAGGRELVEDPAVARLFLGRRD